MVPKAQLQQAESVGADWQSQAMEHSDEQPGDRREAAAQPHSTGSGADRGERHAGTPAGERSQRVHRFAGRLLAALDDATAEGMAGLPLACLNAREAGETVLELGQVIARLQGLRLAVLAQADARDVRTEVDGPAAADTAGWLSHAGLLPGRSARHEVRLSADLTGLYAATGSALLSGEIDTAQAEVVVTAVRRLPDWVATEDRARAEKHLLGEARRLDAAQLRRAGLHLLAVIDPDAAEEVEARRLRAEEDDADRRTSLTLWDDAKGTTHVFAKIPTRHGEMLRTALQAIANPQLPDAITRTVKGPGAMPTSSVDARVLAPRPTPEIMGEALCRLVETLDPSRLPTSGGMSATVVITMSLETLRGGLRPATMDTGVDVSDGEARRMACTAGLIPAVLGGPSEVVDFGRKRRLFSRSQRTAMAVRQGFRCAAEGCDRPTAWADAHHLTPWSQGGKTDLDEGVLICARHHTLAHHPDYQVRRQPGGRISILRKPRDTPRRH